jgi:cell division protein FtsI (penicillin-binding protein 3)
MSKGFASSYRIVLLAGGLFVCFGALGVRLYFLHVVDRDDLLLTVAKTRQQLVVEQARRGDILDARGATLATSRSTIILGVDPMSLRPQDEPRWPQLASLIGMPEAELRRIFTTRYRAPAPANPVPPASAAAERTGLVFSLTPAAAPALAADNGEDEPAAAGPRPIRWAKLREDVAESSYAEIEKLGIRGVYGERVYRRTYPNNQLAAHLIGYVDRSGRPVTGVEYYADFYLRGQNGWSVGEKDGRGRHLAQFRMREVPPADGYSVMLSIDSLVQAIVEQELAYIVEKFSPLKATIIVSDPRDGFILALGNHPSFNLNEYNKVPREEMARLKNVAVADVYEPGSVFKIVAAAAALEERLVTPQTAFNCSSPTVVYKGRTLRLPADDHPFDRDLSVAEILAKSSNRGAAHLGMLLGDERLHAYAQAFGFGRRLGFPVGGEVSGTLHPPNKWDGLTITRMPMGHAVDCTVLQMHQAMSVIANGGELLRPQIVRQIRDASRDVVFHRQDGIVIERAISDATARTVAMMLLSAASKEGTAPEAAIPGFDVAGKTGTTQKLIEEIRPDGSRKLVYSRKHHVASFVGFFPAGRPQVAISVVIDEAKVQTPRGVAYGRMAAPSFKRIGEKLIPILDIKPAGQPPRAPVIVAAEGGRR